MSKITARIFLFENRENATAFKGMVNSAKCCMCSLPARIGSAIVIESGNYYCVAHLSSSKCRGTVEEWFDASKFTGYNTAYLRGMHEFYTKEADAKKAELDAQTKIVKDLESRVADISNKIQESELKNSNLQLIVDLGKNKEGQGALIFEYICNTILYRNRGAAECGECKKSAKDGSLVIKTQEAILCAIHAQTAGHKKQALKLIARAKFVRHGELPAKIDEETIIDMKRVVATDLEDLTKHRQIMARQSAEYRDLLEQINRYDFLLAVQSTQS